MRILLALALLALTLAGCKTDPYPGETGVWMHAALRELPKSMDPPLVGENASAKLASQVYEGLLEYHPFAQPYQLRPALASALPTVSDDGLTYTFSLRPDVRFHDDACFPDGQGRRVTAHDFVWAFKRLAHPDTQTKGWWLFDGKVVGFNGWRDRLRGELEARRLAGEDTPTLWGIERDVPGITALDDHTLQLTLTQPYPQLLWVLAMPYAAVYPREAVDHYGAEFRNHPVGTGPFRLASYNPVYRARFVRNPTYRHVTVPDPVTHPDERYPGWEADRDAGLLANAGKAIPLVDGLEVRFILEGQPRWLYFKAGHLDWINPPKDNTDEALVGEDLTDEMKARGVKLDRWPELGTVYLVFNTLDETVGNRTLRQAIANAVDHRWMVDNLYSQQAVVATSLVPPGVAGFDGAPAAHPHHRDDGAPDLERARALLAEAGYPDGIDPETGKPLRLRFELSGTSTVNRQFGARLRDDLRRIGIEVDTTTNTFPQLVEKMRGANYQMSQLAWSFDYPDAQNILQLLYGPNRSPGIGGANFADPAFDALYDQAAVLEDSPQRTALYQQMARIVATEVPWVTRAHRIRTNVQQPWLQGFKYTEVHDQAWRVAGIDAADRARRVADWNRPVWWPVVAFGVLLLGAVGATVAAGRRRRA